MPLLTSDTYSNSCVTFNDEALCSFACLPGVGVQISSGCASRAGLAGPMRPSIAAAGVWSGWRQQAAANTGSRPPPAALLTRPGDNHRPSAAVRRLPATVRRPPGLPATVRRLSSTVCRRLSDVCCSPSSVHRLLSVVFCLTSSARRLLSAVYCLLFQFSLSIFH